MHPTIQILSRHQERFAAESNLLILCPPADALLTELDPKQVITFDFRTFTQLQPALKERVCFGPPQKEAGGNELSRLYDAVLVFVPKAKNELDLLLALALGCLSPEGRVYLVGEKRGGVSSAAKKLEAVCHDASKIDSAKHCQLWLGQVSEEVKSGAQEFRLNDWLDEYTVEIDGRLQRLYSLPGVFSFGRLDDATQLLLENLPRRLQGRVLDFGCGSGVIGLSLAARYREILVECVDISWLALQCTRLNAERLGLSIKVYPSDGWSEVEGRVDAVFTNPPFHSGVSTEYQTSEGFILSAPQHMSKHAPMVIVANSFLKYPPVIEKAFGSYKVLAETTKFRLYQSFR